MSDDVRAAALEIIAEAERADGKLAEYQGNLVNARIRHGVTVARALLAEHPADDGEAVTMEWARDRLIPVWKALESNPEEWAKRAYRELSRVLLHFLAADVGDKLAKAMNRVR